jgi:hypothetical protein
MAKPLSAEEKAHVADQRRVEQRQEREKRAKEKAQMGTLWSRRDVFGRFGWGIFTAFSGITLLGFLRSAFPRVLFQPPSTFKAGVPSDFIIGEVSTKFQKDQRVWIIREEKGMYALREVHAPRLHAALARGGEQVQVPVPRQRLLQVRHQLRGPGAAPARASAHHEGGRRTDPDRQGGQVPLREGAVGQARCLPEGVIR